MCYENFEYAWKTLKKDNWIFFNVDGSDAYVIFHEDLPNDYYLENLYVYTPLPENLKRTDIEDYLHRFEPLMIRKQRHNFDYCDYLESKLRSTIKSDYEVDSVYGPLGFSKDLCNYY